jgi:hypothetical protein
MPETTDSICYGLDLEYPPKAHMLKAQFPACGATVRRSMLEGN